MSSHKDTDDVLGKGASCPVCKKRYPSMRAGQRCPRDGAGLVVSLKDQPAKPDPMIGRVFAGKYEVLGVLGQGAMGAVYRALQKPVGREVALKVIRGDKSNPAMQLESRFEREAHIVARLKNPAVVTLYDHGAEPDGVLYMVMELVKGERLDHALARGPLPAARAVAITREVCRGLTEAHELGLVHRDLKPENLMLVKDALGRERVKILDFGIAKVLSAEGGLGGEQTRAGSVIGTPRYMSPEQTMGGTVDARSDVYSMGVVLYEMLAGVPLFSANTPVELLMAHREDPVPPFSQGLGVPPAVEAVVHLALEKHVSRRIQSARELADALGAALAAPVEQQVVDDSAATATALAPFKRPEQATLIPGRRMEVKTAPIRQAFQDERPKELAAQTQISRVALAIVAVGLLSLLGALALWLLRSASTEAPKAVEPAGVGEAREPADAPEKVKPK